MKLRINDTIAAIATPIGVGAISIVRMSGPDAISIAEKVFRGSTRLATTPGHVLRHGRIVDKTDNMIDEVLVAVFRTPHSYTGEDSVEISCHGGMFVTKRVLLELMESGARQADPGEFTRRAFLNGKMDLSQAEAVSDIVSAGSERALRNSNTQLGGSLASRVHKVKDGLVKVCALIELDLDFSEEGERVVPVEAIIRSLDEGAEEVQSAISSFRFGKILRDGIGLAIVGRPNVGKSSIFNRLLQEERSIVSPVPGTTRDFLEETFTIDGLSVRLCDTAGLRVSRDDVEAEGIARTLLVTKSADVVLLVLDATIRSGFKEDIEFLRASTQNAPSVIIAINKADLAPARDFGPGDAVWISALTGDGFDELRSRIRDSIGNGDTTIPSEVHLTSYRQVEVLRRCSGYLTEATAAVRSGMSGEFVAADLRLAIDALSEITGEVTSDDILEHIFSRFCIGK